MGSSPIRDQTRLLRRQVDPLPLHHQGGPGTVLQLKALCGGGTISQGPSAVLRPLLGQPSPWVALSALGVGWGSQQVPLTGNQTLCHFDPFSGFMLMEKLLCGTLPALHNRKENIGYIASQSFSSEMSRIILVHISLVQRGHA